MATTARSNRPDDYFRLFDLPQELQDRIFGYAYAKSKDVNIVKRGSREHKTAASRLELSREAFIDMLSKYKVDEWLICKKWFVGAAKAYVSNSLINLHVARGTSVGDSRNTLYAFAKHLVVRGLALPQLTDPHYPPRQFLTMQLQVSAGDFDLKNVMEAMRLGNANEDFDDEQLEYNSGLRRVLSDEQLEQSHVYTEAKKLRGILVFEIVAEEQVDMSIRAYRYIPEARMNLEKNMRRLEELLKPIVTLPQPKEELQTSVPNNFLDDPPRLYPESKVCANTSTLADRYIQDRWSGARNMDEAHTLGMHSLDQIPGNGHTGFAGRFIVVTHHMGESAELMVQEARAEVIAM